jgi:hypothetical protein
MIKKIKIKYNPKPGQIPVSYPKENSTINAQMKDFKVE